MSFQITSKLELNLLKPNTSPQFASDFAIKNRVPAIVASPEYIAPLIAHRSMMNGGYKIICALDFPKGTNFAMDKLFRANPDFVAADGFDVLLSTDRSSVELTNEMKSIHSYLKANRPMCDIRWCLRMHSVDMEEIVDILKNMKKYPPSMVRIDPHLDAPNVDLEALAEKVEIVAEHVPYPIKVSGNVNLDIVRELKDNRSIKRFDVSMDQATAMMVTMKNEVKGTKEEKQGPKDPPPQGPAVKQTGPKIKI